MWKSYASVRNEELFQPRPVLWSENYSRSLPAISTWLATCLPATSHTSPLQPRDVQELRFIMHCRTWEFQQILWACNLFVHRALNATLRCSCFFSHFNVSERKMVQGTCAECSTPTNRQCCCLEVFYCSQACQSTAWPEHKSQCPFTKVCKMCLFAPVFFLSIYST